MTTRKDFIAAAKTISEIENISDRSRTAEQFAKVFKQQNPRFDYYRFYTACKVSF